LRSNVSARRAGGLDSLAGGAIAIRSTWRSDPRLMYREITTRPCSHQLRQRRHDDRRVGDHAAPALGLEALGHDGQPVRRRREALEPEIDLGDGRRRWSSRRPASRPRRLGGAADRRRGSRASARTRGSRATGSSSSDLALDRRRAEQVGQRDQRLQIGGRHPPVRIFLRQRPFGSSCGRAGIHAPARWSTRGELDGCPSLTTLEVDGVGAGRRDLGRPCGESPRSPRPTA